MQRTERRLGGLIEDRGETWGLADDRKMAWSLAEY